MVCPTFVRLSWFSRTLWSPELPLASFQFPVSGAKDVCRWKLKTRNWKLSAADPNFFDTSAISVNGNFPAKWNAL
jgi:hypothetical protein